YMQFFAVLQSLPAYLGAHRWERACAASDTGGLAGAHAALPQRARVSIRALPCIAFRRNGNSHMRGRTTPIFFLQCRSDYRLPSVDWNAALCRTFLYARNACLGTYDRFSLRGKRDAAEGLRPMGHAHPRIDRALGEPARSIRGAR